MIIIDFKFCCKLIAHHYRGERVERVYGETWYTVSCISITAKLVKSTLRNASCVPNTVSTKCVHKSLFPPYTTPYTRTRPF